jgi:hypothetical protein
LSLKLLLTIGRIDLYAAYLFSCFEKGGLSLLLNLISCFEKGGLSLLLNLISCFEKGGLSLLLNLIRKLLNRFLKLCLAFTEFCDD